MAYQSELDRFDMERGDVLSIPRETCIELSELEDDISKVVAPLFKWMSGKPGDPIPDVKESNPKLARLYRGMLLRLIEHQKANAARRADFLASQKAKGIASGAKRTARKQSTESNHGQPRSTEVNQVQDKEKEEEQVPEGEGLVSSSLTCPTYSVGSESQPPSAGACAGARPAAVESGHAMRTATIAGWTEHGDETFDEGDLRERPVQFVLDMGIDEDENLARPFYMKALQQLGPVVYAETCWRFIEAYVAAANAYGKTMRELEKNWDTHKAEYTAKGETWNDLITRAENKNWHLIKTERECYERHSDGGGRILAGMLKEAGLANGIDLGAKRTKKGGE